MTHKSMALPEIRREGLKALFERLGPSGAIRFLQQYDAGNGDYTKDRHVWLDGLTAKEIARDIEGRRE